MVRKLFLCALLSLVIASLLALPALAADQPGTTAQARGNQVLEKAAFQVVRVPGMAIMYTGNFLQGLFTGNFKKMGQAVGQAALAPINVPVATAADVVTLISDTQYHYPPGQELIRVP